MTQLSAGKPVRTSAHLALSLSLSLAHLLFYLCSRTLATLSKLFLILLLTQMQNFLCGSILFFPSPTRHKLCLDKPARLTIRVLWFLFLIVRRVPRPSESGCKKCNGLKKYLLGHTFSWKRLSAILCPWNPPWWWFFSLKLNKKCLKTPSKIKGLSFISSNLGNMDFFLIFNCISH